MKKILLLLLAIVSFSLTSVKALELPEKTDHEKVTIYVFRGHGCSHCYDALSYLYANISSFEDYIEVRAYEVWQNQNNKEFWQQVAQRLGKEARGVPFIVIGSNYTVSGFGASTGKELISTALDEYKNVDYFDLVKSISSEHTDLVEETLDIAAANEAITYATSKSYIDSDLVDKDNTTDTIIIIAILVVVFGGTAALVISNRKK